MYLGQTNVYVFMLIFRFLFLVTSGLESAYPGLDAPVQSWMPHIIVGYVTLSITPLSTRVMLGARPDWLGASLDWLKVVWLWVQAWYPRRFWCH